MWCALAYLRETLAMILIKCNGNIPHPHFYHEIFAKPFEINLLAILTFKPGKPRSPFSPYIGKKVQCKVYNIGYSQLHVSFWSMQNFERLKFEITRPYFFSASQLYILICGPTEQKWSRKFFIHLWPMFPIQRLSTH